MSSRLPYRKLTNTELLTSFVNYPQELELRHMKTYLESVNSGEIVILSYANSIIITLLEYDQFIKMRTVDYRVGQC